MRALRIETAPFSFTDILDVKIQKGVNQLGSARIKGVISEDMEDKYVQMSLSDTPVEIAAVDFSGNRQVIFRGVLENLNISSVNGLKVMELTVMPYSRLLDITPGIRVFQNKDLTYNKMISAVITPFKDSAAILHCGDGRAIGQMFVQYQETAWAFIMRMASMFEDVVVPDDTRKGASLHFGFICKHASNPKPINPISYDMRKDVISCMRKDKKSTLNLGNSAPSLFGATTMTGNVGALETLPAQQYTIKKSTLAKSRYSALSRVESNTPHLTSNLTSVGSFNRLMSQPAQQFRTKSLTPANGKSGEASSFIREPGVGTLKSPSILQSQERSFTVDNSALSIGKNGASSYVVRESGITQRGASSQNQQFVAMNQNRTISLGVSESNFVYFVVKDRELRELGETVVFKGQQLYVTQIESVMEGGELVNLYTLRRRGGIWVEPYRNFAIIGASLSGQVSAVTGSHVKMSLPTANSNKTDTSKWHPFSTVYSSPSGTGWYAMPEKGDSLRLYFPTEIEDEGYTISAVHTYGAPQTSGVASKVTEASGSALQATGAASNATVAVAQSSGGSGSKGTSAPATSAGPAPEVFNSEQFDAVTGSIANDEMKRKISEAGQKASEIDPNNKFLQNNEGKFVLLTPSAIMMASEAGVILIEDGQGITICSNSKVNIGGSDITIASSGQIAVIGNSEVIVQQESAAAKLIGGHVKFEGATIKNV